MIELAIALGLVLSLFLIDAFGLAAGGIVVPGYIALQMAHLDSIIMTFIVAIMTYLIVRIVGRYTFLYGRRQMVLSLLIGCLLAIASHQIFAFNFTENNFEFSALGWVVPGLIAHWMGKQGIIKTTSMLLITSVLVRFSVILIYNGALIR